MLALTPGDTVWISPHAYPTDNPAGFAYRVEQTLSWAAPPGCQWTRGYPLDSQGQPLEGPMRTLMLPLKELYEVGQSPPGRGTVYQAAALQPRSCGGMLGPPPGYQRQEIR